ncbi:MAG: hypothetical protein MJ116_09945 [Lachnospiraceae bacterium]|nr:hypothetical protein [Lachnospiraceae bacterium]
MRYYISDLHYFHMGMNERMDCRGFSDLDSMHEYMIRRWNEKVRPVDEVLVQSFQEQTRATKRMIYGADEPQPIPCVMINCFCMFSDYQPLTLDEWIENDRKRRTEAVILQNS